MEDFRAALAIVAHECAHVDENAGRERQFPGILLDQTPAGYVRLLEWQFAEAFWCEYAVCRISARLAPNEEQRFRRSCLRSRDRGTRIAHALLWNRRGAWETHDDMLVLGRTAFALIGVCGVHAIAQPDGRAYITLPFTADTM